MLAQLAEQSIFGAFHFPPVGAFVVIEAAKMQGAMDEITNQFELPARAELPCLGMGDIQADKDLPKQEIRPGGIGIVKRDYVRRPLVLEKILIDPGDLWDSNQVNAELKIVNLEQFGDQRPAKSSQQPHLHREAAPAIPDTTGCRSPFLSGA